MPRARPTAAGPDGRIENTGVIGSRLGVWNGVMEMAADVGKKAKTEGTGLSSDSLCAKCTGDLRDDIYLFTDSSCLPPLPLTTTIHDRSLMLLAIFPSQMTAPRGNHLKRSRGSVARHQKPSQHPYDRVEERNAPVIAQPEPRSTRAATSNCPPQSRPVSHRRRKRRRFSANCTGALQNHLPVTSQPKPAFPTPTAPPSSSRPDEEDRLSVISERLRLKMSNSSSTAAQGRCPTGQVCTYEDWQDIKELFAKAAEQYNGKHVPNTFCHPHVSFGPLSRCGPTQSLMRCTNKPQKRTPSRQCRCCAL